MNFEERFRAWRTQAGWLEDARAHLAQAEKNERQARHEFVKLMSPSDVKRGEKILVWVRSDNRTEHCVQIEYHDIDSIITYRPYPTPPPANAT